MFDIYSDLKRKAVKLRRQGNSYSEINREVFVSKSTLSLWLRDIELNKKQKKRLKDKMKANQYIGALANKKKRLKRERKIKKNAKKQIKPMSVQDLFYIGTSLYWAEGTKQKKHNPSQRVAFSNSDPRMIGTHLKWLKKCLNVKKEDIIFDVYSHENIREKEQDIVKYWSRITNYPESEFKRIYYKKNKKRKYRNNKGNEYHGLLRISVKKSTDLNRMISGWIDGIYERCGMV